ncbi:MAG: dihydropteroate synthase [Candidatus Nanopelagicales bacterium]
MLSLRALADLVAAHGDALDHGVNPVTIAGVRRDLDAEPLVMGVVNLSRDSTYRDSVAVSTSSAIRRARIMHAQGAGLIDIGAESTTARARRIGDADQIRALVPVIESLDAEGVPTSVEAYSPVVIRACLRAGAAVVNLTGTAEADRICDLAAEHGAAVILCFVPNANVRDIGEVTLGRDPLPDLCEHFAERIERARARGVADLIVDPGLGFYYANLTDPLVRARHQAQVLLNSFRLRQLGVPVCQAMPHAFDLFEEEFRTAESFFALMSLLGRVNVLRTHEVARVVAVIRAVAALT